MAIIQVAYEVPNNIMVGLINGKYIRFGSVVRNRTGIIAHLKEVTYSKPKPATAVKAVSESATATKSIFSSLKRVKFIHFLAVVVIGVLSALTLGYVKKLQNKKKQAENESELMGFVNPFYNSLTEYLNEVRAGNLNESTLDNLIERLDQLKESAALYGNKIQFSKDQLEILMSFVYDYTRKLAEVNSYNILNFSKDQNAFMERTEDSLKACLSVQKQIFNAA